MNSIREQLLISCVCLAIGIAMAGFFIGHAIIDFKLFDRYVTVKGLAERTVAANQATLEIQFNYASDNLADLYQGIAKAQQTIKEFLVAQGFAATNISFESVSVTDNQSNGYSSNTNTKRFSANAGVLVTTNNVSLVQQSSQRTGELVQKNIVVTQSNVNYFYTQLNSIKPEMLDEATANAKEAAESFAKNSHSRLESIRNASQGLFTITGLSGNTYSSNNSIMKKIRVVTTVQYFLH